MREYTTGNPIVDASAEISITGNITPQAWYRTIVKKTGKPHLTAIVILADIVYWYRPTELRDESTGQIIAIRKKFKADLLQRSYQQIAEQFGLSKKEATNSIVFLEKLGVIKRVFRTVNLNGLVVNNVLYIELIVGKLKELTYPGCYETPVPYMGDRGQEAAEDNFEEQSIIAEKREITTFGERGVPQKRERVSPKKERAAVSLNGTCHILEDIPLTGCVQTNTDINTNTSTTDYTNPVQSYRDTHQAFLEQIGYDAICIDRPYDKDRLDEIVGIAVDVLTTTKNTVRINQEEKPSAIVKSVFWKLDMFSIQFVLNSLSETKTKIRNMRAALLTVLYNAAFTSSNVVMNQAAVNGDIYPGYL
ncbi:TPA: hypothetical protein KNN56_001688 [Clostridioides difficile]|uniref:DUF6017 domain-containing protein n=1 Tax=Clostridioides difficile TaxID=1496 RepID=UPI00038D15C9|nr:DUF6017 domain-containing protein [Clostridioides difficile]EGT4625275.1 hypothetical protein [Clostridioides difficile]ELX4576067.1 hypothetical protein [Clostridioides difficile]EQK76089.1 hypothetical protein QEE_1715 [Clostridioides difficile CD113]MBH6986663.1 hypothetical protein [Clostridioides difficile]MBH7139416.1 hypothetical protein [Clostridioides difficile]